MNVRYTIIIFLLINFQINYHHKKQLTFTMPLTLIVQKKKTIQ